MQTDAHRPLNVLTLVDFLPNQNDPVVLHHLKNNFIHQQLIHVGRINRMVCPVITPCREGLVRRVYSTLGATVSFPLPRDGMESDLEFRTVRYYHLPRCYPFWKARALIRWVERGKIGFDLIHCHTLFDLGLAGLALKKRFGLPLVQTVYGTDVNWLLSEDASLRAAERIRQASIEVLAGADAVIGVSRDLVAKVRQLGVPDSKAHWVPNGFVGSLFRPADRVAARSELGLAADSKIILFAGNLLQTKGLGELIDAVSILLRRGTASDRLKVLLVGHDRGYGGQLRDLIERYSLGPIVQVVGPVPYDRIPLYLSAADVFCLPSWREGWPNTVIEALACGVPVVATRVGGIPEILSSESLGFLCPPRDSEQLAACLDRALKNQWDGKHIAASAGLYEYSTIAGKIDSLYFRLTGDRTPA